MTNKILYLFPDTNLFIQCRALAELDWSHWASFDEVHLIVSRPVIREIDNQKNMGRDRLGKRARKTSALFREVLNCDEKHKLVRPGGPRVTLFIKPEYKHSTTLANTLDYNERDDQLVGTVHAFKDGNSDADVRLLTYDTGPMATGAMVGVVVETIPDDWLLPPENSATDKKINKLQSEIDRLKKAEPDIEVLCIDRDEQEIEKLECELHCYEGLTDNELSGLMARIKESIPPETDFGSRESAERNGKNPYLKLTLGTEIFTPATEEEIAAYNEDKYPAWIEQCEAILKRYHLNLARDMDQPYFAFVAGNMGTRPAKDVLVAILALGDFKIAPPSERDEVDEEAIKKLKDDNIIELPRPPSPPKGDWEPKVFHGLSRQLGHIEAKIRRSLLVPDPSALLSRETGLIPIIHNVKKERDPNEFYWKPERPKIAASSISLTCEQWRHGADPKFFRGELFFDWEEESISGMLECHIHAENPSEIVIKKIPVQIKIKHGSVFGRAKSLVDDLCGADPNEE